MNNADFWASIRSIITAGFTPKDLLKLYSYAAQFISGRLVYQRFSPQEQHGCSEGGTTNVIASLLSGAESGTDSQNQGTLSEFKIVTSASTLLSYAKEEPEHYQLRCFYLAINEKAEYAKYDIVEIQNRPQFLLPPWPIALWLLPASLRVGALF